MKKKEILLFCFVIILIISFAVNGMIEIANNDLNSPRVIIGSLMNKMIEIANDDLNSPRVIIESGYGVLLVGYPNDNLPKNIERDFYSSNEIYFLQGEHKK